MVFSSLIFIFLFLPITIAIYYIAPKFLRNFILFLASLVFYAWGEPVYILIMLFSTVFDYINALLIDKYRHKKLIPKLVFINSVVVNLGILSFFKYYNFFIGNVNDLFGLSIASQKLPLPVGISFYTFQTMSYVIDVYRNKVEVQRNIISFGTYVTMFPQLVAGPIVKYGDISKQINSRRESFDKFGEGAELFIIGLSKKVILANNIGILWDSVKATPISQLSVLSAWLGVIAFTFQIYFDFSGYSDMALGLGKMFGFDLMINFNYPYISKSVTEFWRRWHISLGSWFREYVYIPLGGNKNGSLKQYRNLFIVWLLTGLWHGANWNFIFWGLYFGVLVTIEKIFLLRWLNKIPKLASRIYTMIIVIVGWAIFDIENITQCGKFIKTMFGFNGNVLLDKKSLYYLSSNIILFIILIICSTPIPKRIINSMKKRFKITGTISVSMINILLVFTATAYLVNESYNPFLYFRF
ncbi:MBOAT family protein [Clostridium sp. MB40-C1]|uniref:MBOAT family O-acyltransferase n=1 Tax=Clostridium sp. MB40-C1 TaxID=3070996 RepID=UPI0027DF112C|nr:MBOAT family protein [Clostridium sp. MB40-C1]WMJ80154.1 MBOAT family protein [Clostridium sp. MB40-C1]